MSTTRSRITGVLITLAVIVVIAFSGPVTALSLSLFSSQTSVNEQQAFLFDAIVDVHDTDFLLSDTSFTVNISKSGVLVSTCTFTMQGVTISGCDDITVLSVQSSWVASSLGYGVVYGYGYGGLGFFYSEQFGYGYGYQAGVGSDEFNSTPSTGELVYSLRWDTPSVSEDSDYDISFFAHVPGGILFDTMQSLSVQVRDAASSSSNPSSSPTSNSPRQQNPQQDAIPQSFLSNPTHAQFFSNLESFENVSYQFFVEGLIVTGVSFVVNESRGVARLRTIARLDPPNAWVEFMNADVYRRVHSYIEFDHSEVLTQNLVGGALITFTVPADWFADQLIRLDSVHVYELVNSSNWRVRQAKVVDQQNESVTLEARIDELGVIAFTGQSLVMRGTSIPRLEGEVEVAEHDLVNQTDEEDVLDDEEILDDERTSIPPVLFIILGVIILGGIIGVVLYHTHVKKL